MASTSETAVAALLREAEAAHGAYETNELGGVFDEDWPAWYAGYLLEHGLRDHLPNREAIDVGALATKLKQLAANYEQEQPAQPWPEVYAARLVAG